MNVLSTLRRRLTVPSSEEIDATLDELSEEPGAPSTPTKRATAPAERVAAPSAKRVRRRGARAPSARPPLVGFPVGAAHEVHVERDACSRSGFRGLPRNMERELAAARTEDGLRGLPQRKFTAFKRTLSLSSAKNARPSPPPGSVRPLPAPFAWDRPPPSVQPAATSPVGRSTHPPPGRPPPSKRMLPAPFAWDRPPPSAAPAATAPGERSLRPSPGCPPSAARALHGDGESGSGAPPAAGYRNGRVDRVPLHGRQLFCPASGAQRRLTPRPTVNLPRIVRDEVPPGHLSRESATRDIFSREGAAAPPMAAVVRPAARAADVDNTLECAPSSTSGSASGARRAEASDEHAGRRRSEPVASAVHVVVRDPRAVFQRLSALGRGGGVFAAARADGSQVALVRVVPASDAERTALILEVDTVRSSPHANIVKRYETYISEDAVWICMEYVRGGPLTDVLQRARRLRRRLTEHEIAFVLREVLRGVSFLHAMRRAHRAIHARNVLLSDAGDVKIAHFGLAAQRAMRRRERAARIGPPYWAAPEIVQSRAHDCKVDLWGVGILAIECAEWAPPFGEETQEVAARMVVEMEPPKLRERGLWSREFHDFLARCLVIRPQLRASATQLLEHPFLAKAVGPAPTFPERS